MFTPMGVVERDWLLVDAAGRDRRERRHRHRHFLSELRLRGDALGRAQLRVGEDPRVAVVLEQPVVDAGHSGHETSARVSFDRSCSVSPSRLTSIEPEMPSELRRRDLQTEFAEAGAIDFEQLDVDDDFRPRLVDRGDEPRRLATCSGVS